MPENSSISNLVQRLLEVEPTLGHSTLAFYTPVGDVADLLQDVCDAYLSAMPAECAVVRAALRDCPGVLNHLMGYAYHAGETLKATGQREWLRRGLAAISIENCRYDYRDVLLALADLYLAAEAAGLDPQPDFVAVANLSAPEVPRGGTTPVGEMLTEFHTYVVLRSQRENQGRRS